MFKWVWVHPLNGDVRSILISLNNLCYFFGTQKGTTELHFANGEIVEVVENEQYFLDIMNN